MKWFPPFAGNHGEEDRKVDSKFRFVKIPKFFFGEGVWLLLWHVSGVRGGVSQAYTGPVLGRDPYFK